MAASPFQITPYLNVEPYLNYIAILIQVGNCIHMMCVQVYLEARIQYGIPFKEPQHIEQSSVYLPAQKQFDELNNHAASWLPD